MFKNVVIMIGPFDVANPHDNRKQIMVSIDDHTFVFVFTTVEDLLVLYGDTPNESVFYDSFQKALPNTTSYLELMLVTKHIHRYIMHIRDDT